MVKIYNYEVAQDEVLPLCQRALLELGYEIDTYAPLDYHIVTRPRTIKRFLQRAEYLLHVKIEDRISVYAYAETRRFRRGTEFGIKVDDLTELGPSSNLNLQFQNDIFAPITAEFRKIGFEFWDAAVGNREDDLEIKRAVRKSQEKSIAAENQKKLRERRERNQELESYTLERDMARLSAAEEAEHYLTFFEKAEVIEPQSELSAGWSLVEINKTVISNDETFGEILRDVLKEYRSYRGEGGIEWVVNPDGRVVDVQVVLRTSPTTPEVELEKRIATAYRSLIFKPRQERSGHLLLSRQFGFSGSLHNFTYNPKRPRILSLMPHYPPIMTPTVKDTFFETDNAKKQ